MSNSFAFKSWLAKMFKNIGVNITYQDLIYKTTKETDALFEKYYPQIDYYNKKELERQAQETKIQQVLENKIQYAAEVKQEERKTRMYDDTVIINIPKLIRDFQNSDLEELPIQIKKDKDIRDVIDNVKIRPNYHTTVRVNYNSYIPIGSYRVKWEHFNSIETMSPGSDKEILKNIKKAKIVYVMQKKKMKNKKAGAFFPYINTSILDLTRYGIYNEVKPENYKLNCLVYALKGKISEAKYELLKSICIGRNIPKCKLEEISKITKIRFHLKEEGRLRTTIYGSDDLKKNIFLGLIDGHYFINDTFQITKYALNNMHKESLINKPKWTTIKSLSPLRREESGMSAFTLITKLKEMDYFRPITIEDTGILNTQYYKNITSEIPLMSDNSIKYFTREVKAAELKPLKSTYYFADFETYVNKYDLHIPYMCCIIETKIDNNSLVKVAEKTFYGEKCGFEMLTFIKDDSVTYFHNLGYDFCFFKKYLNCEKLIKTGSMIKMVTGSFKGKNWLIFRDSCAMISGKLEEFGGMFNLDVKKEIMPYGLYTEENCSKTSVPLKEAFKHINKWEIKEFKKLASNFITGEDRDLHLYHIEYAQFYCKADCEVLFQGMKTFREWIKLAFNLDVLQFISLPSLSYRYFLESGCLDNVYELRGPVRMFIQKCVVGGRVMTRDNNKFMLRDGVETMIDSRVKEGEKEIKQTRNLLSPADLLKRKTRKFKINDFDAVSLYPSAMNRIGFLKGKPTPFTFSSMVSDNPELEPEKIKEIIMSKTGYFIRITNIKTEIKRHFPLQSIFTESSRNYTNEFPSDYVMYIDKIALEDFIKYQGATFDIIDGYYYNGKRNDNIIEVIRKAFDERLKKKSEKNAIEVVYKLLMNAGYGKLGQKEITSEYRFRNTQKLHERFIDYNHNFIKEYHNLAPGKFVYKIDKSVLNHYNCCHLASEILSMSKRIMNEVMCLAEDKGYTIYYQDTDSMHINDADIKKLAIDYKAMYNRELIGKQMGQFHSDFKGGKYAVESIFLGKKAYIDKLDTGKFHIRMKGVTDSAIIKKSTEEKYKNSIIKVYESLFNGETVKFNLAEGKPKFMRDKHFSQYTITEFIRNVKFSFEKKDEKNVEH